MGNKDLDVAVIGAGHAGLSISYFLKQLGLKHLVIERGKVGNTWRTQRWDSFKFNTPNRFNLLPGMKNNFMDPEGFCSSEDFVACLENYHKENALPVMEHSEVLEVENNSNSPLFSLLVSQNGQKKSYLSHQVVVASGSQNVKTIPDLANRIPPHVTQLHASEFRNAKTLPEGAVLIVGSAQSGVQIAEDLMREGRKVYIATSKVARAPRRYRGKDIIEWFQQIGFMDQHPDDLPDPEMLKVKQPQISGVGKRGKTVSLQELSQKGAIILGKLDKADGNHLFFQNNAGDHIKFADGFSAKIKEMVDEFIKKSPIQAPEPEEDPADYPDENANCTSSFTSLNLNQHQISSIIWATGFGGDFNYLKFQVINADGSLKHHNGVSEMEGLYFLGLPWLRKRKSGIIMGIEEDAQYISKKIKEFGTHSS